jgi:ABC-type lipoprotein release transport system permease subunit
MFNRRSLRYAEKVERRKKRNRALFYIGIFLFICILIRTFVLQIWLVRDDLLQPELQRADVVVVIPYERIGDKTLVGLAGSPQVNNIVLVSDGAEEIVPSPRRAVDAMLRFLTLQRFSLLSGEYGENFAVPSVKRIQRIVHSGRGVESVILYGSSAPDDRQAVDRIEFVQQVSATRILGRVLFRIWPISRIGPVR